MKKTAPTKKVGIWSGASPAPAGEIRRGLKKIRKLGIDATFVDANLKNASKSQSKGRPFLAGSDRQKVDALVKLLRDPSFRDILCVRGGYGSVRLIQHLDRIPLEHSDKRIWGFSDMTTLQNYLYFRAQLPWVHSPMLTSNAFQNPQKREDRQWEQGTQTRFTVKRLGRGKTGAVPAKAVVLGGNLTCLASLASTSPKIFPREDFVLFLEDVAEKAYRMDRMLTLLGHVGFFKSCRAVFLGYFTDCPGWKGVFEAWSAEHGIPVYHGLPSGHDHPNIALPMGVEIDIRKKGKNFGSLQLDFPKFRMGC